MDGTRITDSIFYNTIQNQEEYQYLNLVEKIIEKGHDESGRNGVTRSVFGESMRFSLSNGKIPILTTKKTAWKTCLKELLWFIRGQTDVRILQEQNVHIWDGNTTRDFLNSRGLYNLPEGFIGPGYGWQWRNFNGEYQPCNCDAYKNGACTCGCTIKCECSQPGRFGVDQLQQIINTLKDPSQRTSRRLVMTAWNPSQLDQMALPPCHILCQFNVHDGNKLSCSLYQRSVDVALGSPINIASYSFLTHLIAKHCGLEAYEFVYFMGNAHLYEDHIEPIQIQLERVPYAFPTVYIPTVRDNIDDYEVSDFIVSDYKSYEQIKMKMVV